MKLKFKEQEYQNRAVMSVVDCFAGQEKKERKNTIKKSFENGSLLEENVIANNEINLLNEDILENLKEVQRRENITPLSKKLEGMNFTIEMETGTGKTYVYTKTMHELKKHYGWKKFIIMVPSIAIREGVNKSLKITEEHFKEIYGERIRFNIYDNKNKNNIQNIKSFAMSPFIEVIIMNYQAFASKSEEAKKIYHELDEIESQKPIDIINSIKPILIIDEPQKFGPQAKESIKNFESLFILRYSATHKKGEDYNKVYRLDPVDAYNNKLVKKIGVKGIEIKEDTGGSYLFLDKIQISKKHYPIAKIEFEINSRNGIRKILKNVQEGDNLYQLSNNLEQYKSFVVNKIDGYENIISFINGIKLKVGQISKETEKEDIRRIQIRETIKSHLEKERILFKKGIKTLSLFFIDRVEKYRKYDESNNSILGEYAEIFEREYKEALVEYKDLFDTDYNDYLNKFKIREIHNGYFSIDKKGKMIDSEEKRGEDGSSDVDAYDLIMKDKERLLSFEEPTRFIFSHSALREGWDNPNIFQICTLKHSVSEISKRQEIGRGLRICVDKEGERMDYSVLEKDFFNINKLTLIASESYEDYAKKLQTEIVESLYNRPITISTKILIEKVFINKDNEEEKIDDRKARKILNYLEEKKYIDEKDHITEKMIEDIDNSSISLPEEVNNFKESFLSFIKEVYQTSKFSASSNEKANNIDSLELNDNFKKEEFQELWQKIKVKTSYQVSFSSEEIIKKSIVSINEKLMVKKPKAIITYGEQKEKEIDEEDIRKKDFFAKDKERIEKIKFTKDYGIKYDLIGEIAKNTPLKRRTIIEILKNIKESVFLQYRYNPEDFIRQVSIIINEEKLTVIAKNIKYEKINEFYGDNIFFENAKKQSGSLLENIIEVKKHIYNYLRYDSNVERDFAKDLETGDILVYAKLPNEFKIPTPIGNYIPDWAIVFNNNDYKYIYFIAETKGKSGNINFTSNERKSEEMKIECAKKHFETLKEEKLKYDVVRDYKELIEKIIR